MWMVGVKRIKHSVVITMGPMTQKGPKEEEQQEDDTGAPYGGEGAIEVVP